MSDFKPRKIPAQARSEFMVDILIEAAARILEERGFAGYSTNTIAEKAGVSIGSLYQYFPNKDALTYALIKRETQNFIQLLEAAALVKGSEEKLLLGIKAAIKYDFDRRNLAVLLDEAERKLDLYEWNNKLNYLALSLVKQILTEKNFKGYISLDLIASDIMGIIKGMIDANKYQKEISSLERRIFVAVISYIDNIT